MIATFVGGPRDGEQVQLNDFLGLFPAGYTVATLAKYDGAQLVHYYVRRGDKLIYTAAQGSGEPVHFRESPNA